MHISIADAQPTQMEEETYTMVNEVLQHSKRILLELQLYQGAGNAIREVMLISFYHKYYHHSCIFHNLKCA